MSFNHTHCIAHCGGANNSCSYATLGEGPDPEEILTAIGTANDHIALKSGYGKYLSVDSKGRVTGMSEAIGSREQWQPIFQVSLLIVSFNNIKFLSV